MPHLYYDKYNDLYEIGGYSDVLKNEKYIPIKGNFLNLTNDILDFLKNEGKIKIMKFKDLDVLINDNLLKNIVLNYFEF